MVKVEIKQSLIPNAGNGVFATQDIKKGEYICFYDGEDRKRGTIDICNTDMSYAICSIDQKTTRMGYPDPKCVEGVGQLCNDGACPIIRNENDFECVLEDFLKYVGESKKRINIILDPNENNSFKMVALKNIQKGDEIYYSYGDNYWAIKFLKGSTNSFFRLILWHYLVKIDCNEIDDKNAVFIFEAIMNQDLTSDYWTQLLKNNKPRDLFLKIAKQLKIN